MEFSGHSKKAFFLHRTPFRDDENQKLQGKEKVLEILQKPFEILQIQVLQGRKINRHALITGRDISRKVTHAHIGIYLNA